MSPTIVAVTATSRRETPDQPERVRLNAAYLDAVTRAGGIPLVTAAPSPGGADADADAAAETLLGRVDALLLTGGEDVEPARFGARPHPALGRVTPARDAWELALARAARRRRIPTLGVCRGIQLLNVAFGGTLVQDIPAERPDALQHEQGVARSRRTHAVTVHPGTRLAAIMGHRPEVNSMHHQAVADPAPGMTITALAPDGIIEGIEWTDGDWWAVGVQWHPEELDGADAALFAALIEAGARR